MSNYYYDTRTAESAVQSAAGLWTGTDREDFPDWRDNEYLRGQVELLADTFGSPFEDERDWEEVKDWYAQQIVEFACAPTWFEINVEHRADKKWVVSAYSLTHTGVQDTLLAEEVGDTLTALLSTVSTKILYTRRSYK